MTILKLLSVKVKGQAIQFALLVATIVAILLSTYLAMVHIHTFFRIRTEETLSMVDKAAEEIFDMLDLDQQPVVGKMITPHKHTIKVKKTMGYHGAWQKAIVETQWHHKRLFKAALIGGKTGLSTPNFYAANGQLPVVLIGNARLEGNTYVPVAGLKAGNIYGTDYQGAYLHYGDLYVSDGKLPELQQDWLKYLKRLTGNSFLQESAMTGMEKEVKNSFLQPHQLIYDTAPITITDEKITGNVVIKSESQIEVHPAANLKDVLLIAPTIVIKAGVVGRIQMIATERIEIGGYSHLKYPSAAIVLHQNKFAAAQNEAEEKNSSLIIHENVDIAGTVALIRTTDEELAKDMSADLKIAAGVEITGEVYCQGNIDFEGTVKGALYTARCITRQKGEVYLNHMHNGSVLQNPVPAYSGLPLQASLKSLAVWLY